MGLTVLDAHAALVVDTDEAGGVIIRKLRVRDHKTGSLITVTLTTDILRQMGYYGCLWYKKDTGQTTLMPLDFVHPEPLPESEPAPVEPPTPPAPRVRVRSAPPPPPPVPSTPAPTPRVRTRTILP